MGGRPAVSQRRDPPGGLSIDSATALLNSSMARMMPNGSAPIFLPPPSGPPQARAPAPANLPSPSASQASPSLHLDASPESRDEGHHHMGRLWSQQEADLFLKSARRHGRDYAGIMGDLEKAGHEARTYDAIKARYNKLRARGVLREPAARSLRSSQPDRGPTDRPRVPTSSSSSLSTPPRSSIGQAPPAPNKKRKVVVERHRWTDEEKRVLLRIGDEHHKPGSTNMLANVYRDWKKHFPSSKLNSQAVNVHYYALLKKRKRDEEIEEKEEEDDDDDDEVLSSAPSTSSSAPAPDTSSSFTKIGPPPVQRAAAASSSKQTTSLPSVRKGSGGGGGGKKVPGGRPWQPEEVKALERVHRMLTAEKVKYTGPGQVHDAYCRLMPGTERSQASVGQKYLALYADSIRDGDDESSSMSGSLSGSEEESKDEEQQHGRESTVLSSLRSRDLSQEAAALSGDRTAPASATTLPSRPVTTFEKQGCPPARRTSIIDESYVANLQPSAYTALSSSFPSSFPTANPARHPTLDLLTTATPTGLLFENCIGLGISIFGPASFKVFASQQVASLAQLPSTERPAFSFVVGEGGALQRVVAPKGTTMSLSLIGGGAGLEVQRGEGGVRGRMGVESVLRGADGYTITVRNWLRTA